MKDTDESYPNESLHRSWAPYRRRYTSLGKFLVVGGLLFAIPFLYLSIFIYKESLAIDCFTSYPFEDCVDLVLYMHIVPISLGLALITTGGSFVMLPRILLKAVGNACPNRVSLQRRWKAFQRIYILLGGLTLLVALQQIRIGLQYAMSYMEKRQVDCIGPISCLSGFYIGLALAVVGGGLVILPCIMPRIVPEQFRPK